VRATSSASVASTDGLSEARWRVCEGVYNIIVDKAHHPLRRPGTDANEHGRRSCGARVVRRRRGPL